ncbi:MAG: hypothetical protein MAG715_00777 [Methanonatronarchaeales archaeon]|nr:hypothetical protein [Methanonatronarchaeales archaeon]
MDVHLDPSLAEEYSNKAQATRVVTEAWAEEEMYCPACPSSRLEPHRAGKKVEDFFCPRCDRRTQLKAKRGRLYNRVSNSAYEPKVEAIRGNRAPDYAFMEFDPEEWMVERLRVVPGHFLTESVVEKRNPLRSGARRAGWVGSNILLNRIPAAGQILLVRDREAVHAKEVRDQFRRTSFLREFGAEARGWLSDLVDVLEEIGLGPGDEFTLREVYGYEEELSKRHPDNNHVRAKVRQQLQVLRDRGLIEFLGDGHYRLR